MTRKAMKRPLQYLALAGLALLSTSVASADTANQPEKSVSREKPDGSSSDDRSHPHSSSLSLVSAQHDAVPFIMPAGFQHQQPPPYGGGMSGMGGQYGGYGGMGGGYGGMGGGYGGVMDTVNFNFQCKCAAKSNLPKNLPVPVDANQAAQQQVQQLQEQVRRLQEQINRSQQGKSSFEQFAQMLSMADGLDCNCSGNSQPFGGFPSGAGGGMMGGGPYGMGGNRLGGYGGYGGMGGNRVMGSGFGPFAGMPPMKI